MDLPKASQHETFVRVVNAITRVVRSVRFEDISPSTSLTDDLAFDSMKFVDLTVALEENLAIPEFPMQDWIDAENNQGGRAFTVASLVAACVTCTRERQ
jgi:acyl carrier protein